jgi:enoyl-[acyl-carrier protein] reductase I
MAQHSGLMQGKASARCLVDDLGEKNIHVNAISTGLIKMPAASGLGDVRYILKWNKHNAAMRRTGAIEERDDSAPCLLADMSCCVTGEAHHADSACHVVGMKRRDAPDITPARK